MKSQQRVCDYVELLRALAIDIASAFSCIRVEQVRDFKTIESRVCSEGLGFLTKTLPSLGKAIDTALAQGTPLQSSGFSLIRGTQLPRFLGWLFVRVFNSDGTERLDSCPVALRYLRQFLNVFKKLEVTYTDEQIAEISDKFCSTDAGLHNDQRPSAFSRACVRYSRTLVSRILGGVNPFGILPRHGPGAVATGEKNWEKPAFSRIYSSLEGRYPFWEYFSFSPTATCDRYTELGTSLRTCETPTAKVVFVPKDNRGPRLISMEPLEVQWIQQGQMRLMVETIESHRLTRGHVNFTDQTVNRRLALESSASREFVTLDLKDASDRVALNLVQMLFPDNWVEALESSRSHATLLPDGRTVHMNKFAPMGSANCFPVMALVVWALSVAGITLRGTGTLRSALGSVYVYGDDIICRRKDYPTVVQLLEEVGLRVNTSKCCVAGSFRESCGCDAFKGIDVTPIRISEPLTSRSSPSRLASYVAYSNALHAGGYFGSAALIEEWVQAEKRTPYTGEPPLGIAFHRPDRDVRALNLKHGVPLHFCKNTHSLLAKGWRVRSVERVHVDDTWSGVLYASMMPSASRSICKTKDLERDRSGRRFPIPGRVTLNPGWFPVSL